MENIHQTLTNGHTRMRSVHLQISVHLQYCYSILLSLRSYYLRFNVLENRLKWL